MKYLLDTNICIYIINHQPKCVRKEFENISVGELGISSITLSELQYGIERSSRYSANTLALERFISPLIIAPYDARAAKSYGSIRTMLEKKGEPIGSMDLLIAAHALSLGVTLITNNTREFSRIPGLRLENWA